MEQSIISLFLGFWACIFDIYGMLFYMSDTHKITDILKKMNLTAKIGSVLTILVVAIGAMRLEICLFAFLALEYAGVLLWYKKQGKECLRPAFRGVISFIASILVELLIIFVYYYWGIENLEYTGRINSEIKIASYLGIAIMQCVLIMIREIRNMTSGYRQALMGTLLAKTIGDLVWIYACVSSYAFKFSQVAIPLLFIAEILIDYHALCIMVLKLEELYKQDKRADIHENAYEYYLNMEEEHLRIRKMYHEMKNQLMIMQEGEVYTDKEHRKYGKIMQDKLEKMNQFYHTGSPALDILLFDGKKKAEARGIEFEAVVEEGCLFFMEKEDINIIFSNAIINAIEACEKIKEGPRQIKIKAGKNLDDILIYVKNTVSREREKGNLVTSKKNQIMHGIGLTSIQEAVEKYNGYVSIIEEDGTFQLAILFGKGQ